MVSYFLIATLVALATHLLFERRLLAASRLSARAARAARIVLAANVLLLPGALVLTLRGHAAWAPWCVPLARVAFLDEAFVVLLVVAVMARELVVATLCIARRVHRRRAPETDLDRRHALLVLRATGLAAAGAAVGVTAFAHASTLRLPDVRRFALRIAQLPKGLHGVRIAQISDLHVGPTLRGETVAAIVAQVNALEPDLLFITGDLVDGFVEQLAAQVAPLADLRAPLGRFFVTGNHEYFYRADEWIDHLGTLGITVLANEHRVVERDGARLLVAGVCDESGGEHLAGHDHDLAAALTGAPDVDARVLLAHRPDCAVSGRRRWLRRSALRASAWWTVFSTYRDCPGDAPIRRGALPSWGNASLREPRRRLLGSVDSSRRAAGDRAHRARLVKPRRFLFVLWEGGGTNPPELAVASRLVQRGHDVRVLADPTIEADARAAGASFVPYRKAPHRTTRTPESDIIQDWAAATPLGAFARARDRHAFRPAGLFAKETLAACAAHGSDAVVVDAMLFGGLVGAEASRLPWGALISMTSFLPAQGRPPSALGLRPVHTEWGRWRDRCLLALGDVVLWRSCLPLLNRARADVGLEEVAHPLDQIRRASRVLVMTSPHFDFDAPARSGNVVYTGPELADPAWATGDAPVRGDAPLIIVSLSTTYQQHEGLLQRVIDALTPLPARVVVTLGPSLDSARFRAPPSVTLLAHASHTKLFADARLVVTHGGHGTVIRALAAGVPLVVLPLGRDQADNAARVVHAGAGVRLSSRASVDVIRTAVARALADSALREGARAMAVAMSEERNGDAAVEALESIAES